MKTLLFADSHNRWWKKDGKRRRKRDGDEFVREMETAFSYYDDDDGDLVSYKIPKKPDSEKRWDIFNALRATGSDEFGKLDNLLLFCHGWTTGISLGFRSRRRWRNTQEVPALAKAIADVCNPEINIGIFGCLTGRGAFWWNPAKRNYKTLQDNLKNLEDRLEKIVTYREGFAMLLCSELWKLGVKAQITAHLTAGHTTRNPHKVRVSISEGKVWKQRIVWPGEECWRTWVKVLNQETSGKYIIPVRSWRDIHQPLVSNEKVLETDWPF
ncbi:MAG: hypothetical protein ACYTEQ_28335 [Planctomycetota bacterium]|jgi:hypothetical protein